MLWWQRNWFCKFLALINFLSILIPESILTYITWCRARIVLSVGHRLLKKTSIKICISIWILVLIYSVIIVHVIDSFNMTKMCLMFYFNIRNNDSIDTYLLMHQIIFTVLFTLQSIFIATAYVFICLTVQRSKTNLMRVSTNTRRSILQTKLQSAVLVVVNFLGCLPLCVILSIALQTSSETLPLWTAIMVMPTNAVLSPVVYTLRTVTSKRFR